MRLLRRPLAEDGFWSLIDVTGGGLSAVAATCVLAVLPDDHRAGPGLEDLRRNGAHLLPAWRQMREDDDRVPESDPSVIH